MFPASTLRPPNSRLDRHGKAPRAMSRARWGDARRCRRWYRSQREVAGVLGRRRMSYRRRGSPRLTRCWHTQRPSRLLTRPSWHGSLLGRSGPQAPLDLIHAGRWGLLRRVHGATTPRRRRMRPLLRGVVRRGRDVLIELRPRRLSHDGDPFQARAVGERSTKWRSTDESDDGRAFARPHAQQPLHAEDLHFSTARASHSRRIINVEPVAVEVDNVPSATRNRGLCFVLLCDHALQTFPASLAPSKRRFRPLGQQQSHRCPHIETREAEQAKTLAA